MKTNHTVACIILKSAWQAVCRPFSDQFRRRSTLRSGSLRSALTALLLAPLAMLHAADVPASKQKPNVVFVVFDDLNNRLGCYGDPVAKSPNLDRLAARGTVFTRNFCQQPICGPSRASFMSGRRPDSLGIWSMTKYLYDLHPDAVTIPQWFMQHGYTAMTIGKVLGGYGKEADFKTLSVPDRRTGGKTKDEFAMPNGAPLPPNLAKDILCENRDVPDEACFDTISANLTISELRSLAKKREPFFLGLGIFKPHSPYKIPKRYWDMYRREDIPAIEPATRPKNAPDIAFHANHEILGDSNAPRTLDEDAKREIRHGYYAAMSFADAQLGRVLDELDRLGIADNTIVVIIGDNGFELGEHDCWGKMTLFGWDGRVPLIISVPGLGKGGAKTTSLSELIDLFPTLTDLCSLPNPPHLDGTSLVPVLKDANTTVKSAALTQHPRPALYWSGGPEALPQVMGYGLFTDRWNYHEWRDFKTGEVVAQELYDNQNDPLETVNLAGTDEAKALIPPLAAQIKTLTGSGLSATGGTVTNYTLGGTKYRAHIFTTVGTSNLTVTAGGNVEVLVVGGGGGGGVGYGAGGGAGGYRYVSMNLTAGTNTVVVGGGGAAGPGSNTQGSSGTDSSFGVIVAAGGGGGGGAGGGSIPNGLTGGSGGGSCQGGTAGTGNTSPTSPSQGNNGANGAVNSYGGGGGGAGSAGSTKDGGSGISNNMTGTLVGYCGGGAGNSKVGFGTASAGGGGLYGGITTYAAANTGGGGLGAGRPNGNGGSGIVIVRYVVAKNQAPAAIARSVSTAEDTAKAITLTGIDPEGSNLTYTIVSNPAHGTFTGTAPNLTYTPDANYNGSDSFTFKVNDGALASAAATVSITVSAVNDAPVVESILANPDAPQFPAGSVVSVFATDVDGSVLTYAWSKESGPGAATFSTPDQASSSVAFDLPGAYLLKSAVSDGISVVNKTVTVQALASGWQTWSLTHFGSYFGVGDRDDPDHDGVANLVEYAIGGDPKRGGSAILPQASIVGNRLSLKFSRMLSNTDITMVVQGADSLSGPWSELASSTGGSAFSASQSNVIISESGLGDNRNVTVQDLYLLTDPARRYRFLRLQVSRP